MSGPDYPRLVLGGSSAIGEFVIGVSPIGGGLTFDVWNTIISQYANSPILTRLITDFAQYLDQTANLGAFFDKIWNIDTAEGHGLDVWGRIIGVGRTLKLPTGNEYFGFQEATDAQPFGQESFYSGAPLTSAFDLADGAYRTLLFAKALANITDQSIPSVNQILLSLFPGRGDCYVTDGQDMTMTYTFSFALSAVELAIVQTSGVLPKPVGVSATVVTP